MDQKYITKETLIKKRGCTESLIKVFLNSDSPFSLSLIEEVEKKESFRKKFEKTQNNKRRREEEKERKKREREEKNYVKR